MNTNKLSSPNTFDVLTLNLVWNEFKKIPRRFLKYLPGQIWVIMKGRKEQQLEIFSTHTKQKNVRSPIHFDCYAFLSMISQNKWSILNYPCWRKKQHQLSQNFCNAALKYREHSLPDSRHLWTQREQAETLREEGGNSGLWGWSLSYLTAFGKFVGQNSLWDSKYSHTTFITYYKLQTSFKFMVINTERRKKATTQLKEKNVLWKKILLTLYNFLIYKIITISPSTNWEEFS